METIKEITIKNRTYYYYNHIINLDECDESKIKINKKDFNVIDIYYLGYEHKKKSDCNVIMNAQFEKGKDDAWYLAVSDKDDVYKKIVDILESIKNKITQKMWDVAEYDNDYMKIKFESNNIFPTGKDVNIHIATIIIRAIFAKDGKYYPQLFLNDGHF